MARAYLGSDLAIGQCSSYAYQTPQVHSVAQSAVALLGSTHTLSPAALLDRIPRETRWLASPYKGPPCGDEVMLVIFDPQATSYEQMRGLFCENHDPSQGKREGNSDHSHINPPLISEGD